MFNFQRYQKADSIQTAIRLLKENPVAKLIAGGTGVLVKIQRDNGRFQDLIDIHDIAELNFITLAGNQDLVMGPGIFLSQVAESPLVLKHIPVLTEAIGTIAGPQIRNMATLGGNICNGVPWADCASPLMALNAVLTIDGADGQRQMPLADFFGADGRVALEHSEILTAITVTRDNYAGYQGHFFKYAVRNAMDRAIVSCAALCKVQADILQDLRLVYSAAAPPPKRCASAENMAAGLTITPELLADIAEIVKNDVNPTTSWRAGRDFCLQIIKILAARVVRQAILNAGGTIH